MPELPEVETIRRDLEREAVGKRIKTVVVKNMRSIRRHTTRKQFVSRIETRKITTVSRKGKYLIVGLDSPDAVVVHLGMSGQLLLVKHSKEPLPKHTHVTMTFSTAGELRFVDPRTFGQMFVTEADQVAHDVPELAHLGFDPLDDVISWTTFGEMLRSRRSMLKTLLMDQRFVAGIGNLYSDEILFAAGLRYDRSSETLSAQEIRRLYRAMIETLHDAIKHRGSSLADEQYRDLFGDVGDFQSQHQVYDREGRACPRCRSPIRRVKIGGRSHFLCSQCQV